MGTFAKPLNLPLQPSHKFHISPAKRRMPGAKSTSIPRPCSLFSLPSTNRSSGTRIETVGHHATIPRSKPNRTFILHQRQNQRQENYLAQSLNSLSTSYCGFSHFQRAQLDDRFSKRLAPPLCI